VPILADRTVDPDAQVRFQTYRHYLVNIQYFIWDAYGVGAKAYPSLTSVQTSNAAFTRIQRRTLTSKEVRSVQRSLRMAWAHETSLRLRRQQPTDVLHVLLHLALPEAYYALYHATQAYMTAARMPVPVEHIKTQNVLSTRIASGGPFPPPWNTLYIGDPRAASHLCTFQGLPQGTVLGSVNQLSTPTLAQFYDLHAMCLKSTRQAFGEKHGIDHKRRLGLKRLPNGFAGRHYAATSPTSLFHFMYRLRLRSNYRDADAFLEGVWSPSQATDFFDALLETVGASLLLLENMVIAYSGPQPFTRTLRAFALADTTNVQRRQLDERHPGIV
jgi:hypothetical protein